LVGEKMMVYPNPFNDKLTLKNTKEMVLHSTLMTMDGKIIGQFESTELEGLSSLASGTYFLAIESDGIINTFIINKQ
jgi:hypothetical protein